MSTALLTPVNLANGRLESKNRWRKQILPFTTIDYGGQKVTFDRKYMQDLIRSFKARSHHQVPLQFADDKNTHTNDPERTRGFLKDLELAEDGLYGIFELGETGAKVIGENGDLGVSGRILQDYRRRVDGKTFPASLQHVLATVDPYIPGMKPWQKVDLANDDDDTVTETIDLSSESVMGVKTKKNDEGQTVTVELSASDYEVFQQMLSDQKAVMALANEEDDPEDDETDETTDGEDTPPADEAGTSTDETDDDETDDDETDDETDDTGAGDRAPAAAGTGASTELSNAVDDVARSQVLELTNQLRSSEVAREIDGLRRAGLAPAIVDAARPGLEAPPAAIELSNGESVDPGQVLRDVLHQVIELANTGHAMIDLDLETGILTGSDSVQERRQQALAAWENEQY